MILLKDPKVLIACAGVVLFGLLAGGGCTLFESEQVAQGRKLFTHYCIHCHGPTGVGDGFNAATMDPKPRDLTDSTEEFLRTLNDQELFEVISRDMQSFEEFEKEYGEDTEKLFVPPTMPTFKYTLSDEERWSLVAFVRTLHGRKPEVDVTALRQERENKVKEAQAKLEAAQKNLDAAEKAAEAKGEEEPDLTKEEEAVQEAAVELTRAQTALEYFTKSPRKQIARPVLASATKDLEPLIERGKLLYSDRYGCHACHAIGGKGGAIGPALDRAGFRLNGTWVYRWVSSPQAMNPETRMPNLGISEEHARAITAYLGTLRAGPSSGPSGEAPREAAKR
jgi:mono/diheme cytochrome c family protein